MTKKLVVGVAATKSYLYCWEACVKAISAACAHYHEGHFLFSTDESEESRVAENTLKNLLPEGWKITTIRRKDEDDKKDYKEPAQIRIAQMQGAMMDFAKSKLRADLFWSVESDVVVPANSLRVLEWALEMPQADGGSLYDVAAGLYQNGLFLCGFGDEYSPIYEDFSMEERKLPERFKKVYEECQKRLKQHGLPEEPRHYWTQWKPPEEHKEFFDMTPREQVKILVGFDMLEKFGLKENVDVLFEKETKRMKRLNTKIKNYPPNGNIWEITAKYGWRKRGWFDFAYPGIGAGSIVPVDWCGMGCTLMNKRALAVADFIGYDGKGTQDLYLCYQRWKRHGMSIVAVPHVLCDHIKPGGEDGETLIHHHAFHEMDPKYKGHIRCISKPWVPI